MNLEMHKVKIEYPEGCNIVIGQSYLDMAAEYLYEFSTIKVPKTYLLNAISIEFIHLRNG